MKLKHVVLAAVAAFAVFAFGYWHGVRDTQFNMMRAVLHQQIERSLTIRPVFRPPFPVKPSEPTGSEEPEKL